MRRPRILAPVPAPGRAQPIRLPAIVGAAIVGAAIAGGGALMLEQAAGLALLAALSPAALLIVTVYLGSARPRAIVLAYLAGAIAMSVLVGVVALIVLRSGHLQLRSNRTPRYGLRTGLGLLILAAAAVVAARRSAPRPAPQPETPAAPGAPGAATGMIARLTARPSPLTALLSGAVVFAPSLTFIAAVQVIATAQESPPLSALGLTLVIGIYVASVWLPFVAYLAFPGPAARWLAAFNGWLQAHGRVLLIGALTVAGAYLTINGLAGLIG